MSEHDDGGPAYPLEGCNAWDAEERCWNQQDGQRGMSLRDYFAGQALMGHLAATSAQALSEMADHPEKAKPYVLHVGTLMYLQADAMIAARKL